MAIGDTSQESTTPRWKHPDHVSGSYTVYPRDFPARTVIRYMYYPLTCLMYVIQVILIISGNLSFLNWLTILPSLACFDDASLVYLFPSSTLLKLKKRAETTHSFGIFCVIFTSTFVCIDVEWEVLAIIWLLIMNN